MRRDAIDRPGAWLGEERRALLASLAGAVLGDGGLLVLTGEVGVGKTTLANALVSELGPRAVVGRVACPDLTVPELYRVLGRAFAIDGAADTHEAFLRGLAAARRTAKASGAVLLVLVDEAQRLAPDVRTALQRLAVLDAPPDGAPLTVLLVAQDEMPVLPGERRHRVRAMTGEEVGDFLRWRLTVAGFDPAAITEPAVREIARLTGGIPRLLERVTDVVADGQASSRCVARAPAENVAVAARHARRLPRRPVIVACAAAALALTSAAAVAVVGGRNGTAAPAMPPITTAPPPTAPVMPPPTPVPPPTAVVTPPIVTPIPPPAVAESPPIERRERVRAALPPRASTNRAPASTRPASPAREAASGRSSSSAEPDPGAVIDWLMGRSAQRP